MKEESDICEQYWTFITMCCTMLPTLFKVKLEKMDYYGLLGLASSSGKETTLPPTVEWEICGKSLHQLE